MTGKLSIWAAGALLSAAALTGCGSSSSGSATASSSAEAASSIAASSSSTPEGSSPTTAYTDAEACAWLKENLSKVPDTAVGAQAQLAIGLSSFFQAHGGLPGADGYALDDALARGCPDLRTAALKKAGIESFGNL
jgi:hypothetical protein